MKLNEKCKNIYYPFYWAFYENNIEMVQLLINYAYRNIIILEFKESDYINKPNIKSETIEILKKYKKEIKILLSNVVIAINDFKTKNCDQLNIKKNEYLVVTNWNCENKGWVYGYRKDNKEEKGLFPVVFIKRCIDEEIG